MREQFIDSEPQLAQFCSSIENSRWLAIDTEFMREKSYYPKLCLLQISDGKIAAAIDPLTIRDLSPLEHVLNLPEVTKVFHSLSRDIVANEGKGIFYGKNALGMSDRRDDTTEGKIQIEIVEHKRKDKDDD